MDIIVRSRNPVRRQFTRIAAELDLLFTQEEIDLTSLRVSFELLENTMTQLTDWDNQAKELLLDGNAEDMVVDREIKEAEDYQRSFLRIKAVRLELEGRVELQSRTTDNMSTTTENKTRRYQLPEIKLRTFSGQLKDWLGWWSQFLKIHQDEEIHNTDKFHYLCQSMENGSEAAALVNSYPQTEENYEKAVQALQDRFGRNDLLLQVYVRELLSLVISNVTAEDKMPLVKLYVSLESHLRSLAALNLNNADPATWLFPLVESSLSEETLRAWQRSSLSKTDGSVLEPPKSRLDMLMEFIKLEVQSDQHISLAQQGFQNASNINVARRPNRKTKEICDEIPTVAGLVSQQMSNCHLCGGSHATHSCVTTRMKLMDERFKLIRERRLCFRCLCPGHLKSACKKAVKCSGCGGKNHSVVICLKSFSEPNTDEINEQEQVQKRRRLNTETRRSCESESTSIHQGSNQCCQTVMLNTVRAFVKNKLGQLVPIRILGDSGCQRSYATLNLINQSDAKFLEHEWLQNVVFGGGVSGPSKVPKHKLSVVGSNGNQMEFKFLARPQLTGNIHEIPPGQWLQDFEQKGVKFTDVGSTSSQADIVIGNDYWGAIRTGRMIKSSTGLIAEETIFGWTLGGCMTDTSEHTTICNLLCSENLDNLWNLEVLGIRDPHMKSKTEEDVEAWEHFKHTVKRDDLGMYVVSLPWNQNKNILPTNMKVAMQRLKNTTTKLKKDGKFSQYDEVFNLWKKEGLIFEVPKSDDGHFIPHRPVFKESATTPVRPVFDASCRIGKNPSLNECIHKGPNLIELIPNILLRFGMEKIGVSADIRKAFQMLKVTKEDQSYLRFLWWKNENCDDVIVYQHERVVFGINCSPFLLGATINHHLENWKNNMLTEKLYGSFYVDNLLTSVSTIAELQQLKQEAENVLKNARMELRQWAWSATNLITPTEKMEDIVPVLGLQWNRQDDTLRCCPKLHDMHIITKRKILSCIASVFDPMGYLCPAMVFPKMLLQEIWATKIGWDEEVPLYVQKKFISWSNGLEHLKAVVIPRYSQMDLADNKEIHIFCDSSKHAMGAVAFLKTEIKDCAKVQFLFAKSRVTPVNKLTIPRAELVSCVIGTRVGTLLTEAGYTNIPMHYWTDSSTALAWIKRNGDWGVFVANRVKEIGNATKPLQWRHIPGEKNPADLPSRGCTPAALVNSKWWEGPDWLRDKAENCPVGIMKIDENEIKLEIRKVATMFVLPVPLKPAFSTYRKNVAVWAWVLRFVNKVRKTSCENSQFVKVSELRAAEKLLLKRTQNESFELGIQEIGGIRIITDVDGLLKVKSRLDYREDKRSFIYPIVLPNSHPMVDLLIGDVHRYHGHGGIQFVVGKLREKYWILQTRKAVRRVVKKCIVCKRHSEKRIEVEPAPLPAQRVRCGSVFTTVGVDLAGPLYLKNKDKVWIVLYTCAVYRAVHLDLVTSLSTEAFLRSLERFIGVYGRPNTLWSDNGTNFVGASNLFKIVDWQEVNTASNVKQIDWKFNPPTASWWGGFYERLIRSVKSQLRRMIGRSRLNYDELLTCLAGVTATINDRPLTVVSEDNDDLVPLTPSMFFRARDVGQFPELEGALQLSEGYRKMKVEQKRLQERFRKEYLALLVTRGGKKVNTKLEVGDVVLVGSDNRKRFEWPLGRIEELIAGKDGVERVAKVKTQYGSWVRPLQRLFPLEVTPTDIEVKARVPVNNVSCAEDKVIEGNQTRSGRVSKVPARYGQWLHVN